MKTFNKSIFRTLLMAVMMVMGMGNAQAVEIPLWTPETPLVNPNQYRVPEGIFDDVTTGGILRIYGSITNEKEWSFGIAKTDWSGNVFYEDAWHNGASAEITSTYIDFEVTTDAQVEGLQLVTYNWDHSEAYTSMINGHNFTLTSIAFISSSEIAAKHTLTITVDGVSTTKSVAEGATLASLLPTPTKADYNFTGWSGLPEDGLMPDHDIEVVANFSVIKYYVFFKIDNEKVDSLQYAPGETVAEKENPAPRTGYTFSGWSGYPENMTMPNRNVEVYGRFSLNHHDIHYQVDGNDFDAKYYVEYGVTLVPDYVPSNTPTKEGYIFNGWVDLPTTMPDYDLTVQAGFVADPNFHNYKTITYYVDYNENSSTQWEVGTTITPATPPTKEGYTFSGWQGFPDDMVMPNNNLTISGFFTINKHNVIYMVDGEVYKTVEFTYGYDLYAEQAPTKEGYTFSGWSGFPDSMKMPDQDLTITGTFTKDAAKTFTLTYYVDNAVYKTYTIEEKTAVTPEPLPTKEGYTFNGWYNEPETMPSQDWTVSGSFLINSYKMYYVIDGETVKVLEYQYGATVYAEAEPSKEGYLFSGWSEIPSTMPAHDVTITGSYLSASATVWKVTGETATAAGTTLVDDAMLTANTVYETQNSSQNVTIAGQEMTNYLDLRVNAAPSDDALNGTEYTNDGQTHTTSITITPKKNVEVTIYYRRQATEAKDADGNVIAYNYDANDGKDLRVVDQADPTTIMTGRMVIAEKANDEKTAFTTKTYVMQAGHTYTVWARGTTVRFYGLSYVQMAAMKYTVTYLVGNSTFRTVQVEEGAAIPQAEIPTQTGYTFTGWNPALPEVMPSNDLSVTAQFSINTYTLTFKLDNEVYVTQQNEFGSSISAPADPDARDGYTFSGWQNVPAIMPAQDVVVNGYFYKELVYETLSVGEKGVNTFCTTQPLYFQGNEDVKAFIAMQKSATEVTLKQVIGSVAAGTGLVLMSSTPEASAQFEVLETGTAFDDNLLVGVTGEDFIANTSDQYVLVFKNDVLKFADTANTPATIPVGKAYLQAPAGSSRVLTIVFEDEATAIYSIKTKNNTVNENVYNLSGQRVSIPRKGLYIVGGKKVIVK